jgi:hypothetical protein
VVVQVERLEDGHVTDGIVFRLTEVKLADISDVFTDGEASPLPRDWLVFLIAGPSLELDDANHHASRFRLGNRTHPGVLSEIVGAVLDFTFRRDVGVLPVGMLDVPMEIGRIVRVMGHPLVVGRIQVSALIAARRMAPPIGSGWCVRMRTGPG